MDIKDSVGAILTKSENIALATLADGKPDVRIVNCIYDETTPGVIYILTDAGTPKTEQFKACNNVAIASIPGDEFAFVRSNDATVCEGTRSIDDMSAVFEEQVFAFDKMRKMKGDKMRMYEIHMKTAFVQADFKNRGMVSF